MKYSEFLEQNNNLLVKINHDDDVTTGWYRLLETESHVAQEYLDKGFKVFTILMDPDDLEDDPDELIEEGLITSPYVQGYFVCNI